MTTNGLAGGTLTYSWYYVDEAGVKQTIKGSATTVDLRAGILDIQTFTAMESFAPYTCASSWGIDISTSPTAIKLGTGVTDPIPSTGCIQ